MKFNRINNITGWLVCLFACTVYIMTSEATGSLWDCGEFVSSCYKVQIPHPPGAPLFVLIGRIFIVLFGDNPLTAAKGVNIMSALASGFTILFLFWTITHFARKIVQGTKKIDELTSQQLFGIMAAGIIGSLAYTFSDSFWYSAVEGEVYAMSSFFTAIVFWAILKWEHSADEPGADRWIVFLFFLMGLSIGVHLLNLLTIPAIVMVYYFRKRSHFNYAVLRKYFIRLGIVGGALGFVGALVMASAAANSDRGIPVDPTLAGVMLLGTAAAIGLLYFAEKYKPEQKEYYGGMYIFFVIGCVLVGVVQVGVIQETIKAAGYLDIFFVNSLGLPFSSGFTFFFVLLAALIWMGLRFANKKHWHYLRLGLWCLVFMLIGYSSYVTTVIRSNANPSVDMYNVDNPMSLVGYLGRDQYGDFPILYGQKFTAQPISSDDKVSYQKSSDNKYIPVVRSYKYIYAKEDLMLFPRMWDQSNDQGHAAYYANFAGIRQSQDGQYERSPSFMDNIRFFISYQNYFMYIRYFMWNFSGKQNDIQGLFAGNVRDGNWISGIPLIDNAMYGDQSLMPDSLKNNKAHNSLFMLPFILGLIGAFYHFKRRGSDAFVNLLLFFFTGFAIVIYLNQPGYQPRERDYAYVGSFYAYAVWIGLAVLYFIDLASSWDKKILKSVLISGGAVAALFLVAGMATNAGMLPGIGFAALFALVAAGIPFILKMAGSKQAITTGATVLSLAVPVWMGMQEWDDHDRHQKVLARDLAKDYLESCAPNAILFTFGDNDTYPLWYAQEVEGIRPDIRVINTSLLGTDWYINEMRYKVNQSAPIDALMSAAQIEGNNRDVVFFQANPQFPDDRYYDLYDMMKNYVGSDVSLVQAGNGNTYNSFPVHKVAVPVDLNTVRKNGTVNATDSVMSEMRFTLPGNSIYKNNLAILNVIAANKWQRPIYFTMPFDDLGFQQYLRKDGMAYRLVPVLNSSINTDRSFDVIMNKFTYGNANLPGVYFDEENRRHLNIIRRASVEEALDLAEKNRKDDAKKVLNKCDKMMLTGNFPYGMASKGNDHNRLSLGFAEACYRSGDTVLASKVVKEVKTDLQQQMMFYNSLTGIKAENMDQEKEMANNLLQMLEQMQQVYGLRGITSPERNNLGADSSPALVDTARP